MERKRAKEYQLFYLLFSFCVLLFTTVTSAQEKKDQSKTLEAQADTLLNRQDFEGALSIYNKIVKKTKLKKDEDYKILYKRSLAYYGLGKFETALRDIEQFILKFSNPEAILLRAYLFHELSNDKALLEDLNTLIITIGDNPDVIRWRTSVLFDLGKYQEAQRDLKTLMAFQPDPGLQLYFGLTHYYLNNIDSAFKEFDNLIATQPSFVQTYEYAGSICIEEGYFAQALQYINKGLALDPDNATLLFYKGAALVEMENDEGCRFLRKAFDKGFDEAAGYLKEHCFGIEGR